MAETGRSRTHEHAGKRKIFRLWYQYFELKWLLCTHASRNFVRCIPRSRFATAAEALARNVRFNVLRERWDVAKEALHVYDVAKSLVRRPRGAALVPHVRAMRKALGRQNGSKRKQAPETVPVPPPVK